MATQKGNGKGKGRKAIIKGSENRESEFSGVTVVHVLRVPRTDDKGAWLKSARGSLLMDTLCFPQSMAVSVKTRDNADPSKWVLSLDEADFSITDARAMAIGTGSIKDTTTGIEYMLSDAQGMDAIPKDIKAVIIKRCKRRTVIQRLTIACKILKGVAEMQGIGNCFTDAEKVGLFNKPAELLNKVKDTLLQVKEEKQADKFFDFA